MRRVLMSLLMAQKANILLEKYEISEYPIPIHTIEQIIVNEKYNIIPLRHSKTKALIIGNTVVADSTSNVLYREYLAHELCHIQYHTGNQMLKNPWQIRKEECQARLFTAYFLMPVGTFEEVMKACEYEYYLSQEFGVTVDLVRLRKQIVRDVKYESFNLPEKISGGYGEGEVDRGRYSSETQKTPDPIKRRTPV